MRLNDLLSSLSALQKTDLNPEVFTSDEVSIIGVSYDPEYQVIVLEVEQTKFDAEDESIIEIKLSD